MFAAELLVGSSDKFTAIAWSPLGHRWGIWQSTIIHCICEI